MSGYCGHYRVSTTVNIADITSDLILTGQNTAEPKLSVEIASLQLEVGAVLTVDCGLHEYQHDHVNTGHTALVTSVTPALLTLVLISPGHVARSRVKIVSHYLQPHAHNGDLVSGSTKN